MQSYAPKSTIPLEGHLSSVLGGSMIRSIVLAVSAVMFLAACGLPSVELPTPVTGSELAVAEGQVITVYKTPT